MSYPPLSLHLGQKFIGPDHYGCMNTGLAPAILHSRWLHAHPHSNRGFKYVVGPDIYLQQAAKMLVAGQVAYDETFVDFSDRIRVTFARSYDVAKRRFAFLVKEIKENNARLKARHEAVLDKARTGDLQAVLDLGDF
jgi:hypothetical protein